MRILLLFSFLWLTSNGLIAQSENAKSDLRVKVDSIIKYQIQYEIDSTTDKLIERKKWDPAKYKGMYPSFSSFSPNPMTKIILNMKRVPLEELNRYKLRMVKAIKVFGKNDAMAAALYGSSGRNGVIIITTKRRFRKDKQRLR